MSKGVNECVVNAFKYIYISNTLHCVKWLMQYYTLI
jgi:hypothetical protein